MQISFFNSTEKLYYDPIKGMTDKEQKEYWDGMDRGAVFSHEPEIPTNNTLG